jgi:transcription elongation factor Elf1
MLNNDQKKKIKEIIDTRIKDLTCPMCNEKNFIMADGYFNHTMQVDLNSLIIGGQSIPTIAIICNNCGFMSQHAAGILGLLPQKQNKESDEPK